MDWNAGPMSASTEPSVPSVSSFPGAVSTGIFDMDQVGPPSCVEQAGQPGAQLVHHFPER